MVIEKSGPRIFVVIRGNNSIEVFDRTKRTLIATWPIAQEGKKPTAIGFDEDGHRLFVGTRDPGKLIVLNSDSGKVVSSMPAAAMVDDLVYDDQAGHIPTAFRAKTAILVPELNRFYLGVPHHEKQAAELRVYNVLP